MIACPNTNTPEWQNLVSALGEKQAEKAFVRNNYEIPSVEKAAELLQPVSGENKFVNDLYREEGVLYSLEKKGEKFTPEQAEQEAMMIQRKFKFRINTTYLDRRNAAFIADWVNKHSAFNEAGVYEVQGFNKFVVYINPKGDKQKRLQRDSDSLSESSYMEMRKPVNLVLEKLLPKFKGVKVAWISPAQLESPEFKSVRRKVSTDRINAFAKGDTIYFIDGRVSQDVAVEEVLHFFTEALKVQRPGLFTGLFQQAKQQFPQMWEQIQSDYPLEDGFTETNQRNELVTKVLQKELQDEINSETSGRDISELKRYLKDVFKWIKDLLDSVFLDRATNDLVDLEIGELSEKTTFAELAAIVNTNNIQIYVPTLSEVYYNLDKSQEEDDAEEVEKKKAEELLQRKLERIDEQLDTLSTVLKRSNLSTSQRASINTIKTNLTQYRKVLETTPMKTKSVTTVIGAYESPNQQKSQDFANFGTFIHNVMEQLQLKSIATGKIPAVLMNRELFDQLYEEAQASEKTEFKILNLNADKMYEMAVDLVSRLSPYYTNEYVVLPEMTITGVDSFGTTIVGRLDFMAIDRKGNVNVVDLKTTKLSPGETSLKRLKTNSFNIKYDFKDGVHPDFAKIKRRSKVMSFDMQLSLYQQMLKQMGLSVSDKTIIALLYTGKSDAMDDVDAPFVYDKYQIHPFTEKDYAYEAVNLDDEDGELSLNRNFITIRKAAQRAIPVKSDEEVTDKVDAKATNLFDGVQGEKLQALVEKIKKTVAEQIELLRKDVQLSEEYKADPAVKQYYLDRQQQLYKLQEDLNRMSTQTDGDLVALEGLKLSAAVQGFAVIAEQLEAESIRLSSKELTLEEKTQVFGKLNKQVENLQAVVDTLRQIGLNAGLNSDSELLKYLNNIDTALKVVHQKYVEIGRNNLIQIIRKMNPEKFTAQMYAQKNAYNEGRIKYVNEQLEKVQDPNWKPSLLKNPLQRFRLEGEALEKERQARIAALQAELEDIQRDMKDQYLTDDRIAEYVSSTFMNEKSKFYLGGTINPDMGFTLDDIIASVGNSELAIASVGNYLREMTEQGYFEYFNKVSELKVDDMIKNFISKSGSEAAANKAISESVQVKVFKRDGTIETKEYRSFINPVTQAYKEVFDAYHFNLNSLTTQIKELKPQVDGQPENQELKDRLSMLRQERSNLRKEHLKWYIENCNTKLKTEVYQLQYELPADVSQQLEDIDSEIDSIVSKYGPNNEETMDEHDIEIVEQLELERRKITYEATRNNPEYQAIIEKYNEFFYYDYNRGFFNRLAAEKEAKYNAEGTPELYEEWYRQNTRKVPTDQYYEDVEKLMNRLSKLSEESNPELSELIKEQRRIVKKYRVRGRFDTRNMDQADIDKYEELEANIELIKDGIAAEREGNKLPSEKFRALMDVVGSLNRIREKRIGELYDKEYNKRFVQIQDKIAQLREKQELYESTTNPKQKSLYETEYLALEKDFENTELEFKAWFDKNHKNKYELGTLRGNKILTPNPKNFHYETVPALEKYYETVPSEKYRVRRYKDEAFNTDYQETVEGYAVPKGLKITNGRYEVTGQSQYINPNFVNLQQNKDAYEFYNAFVLDNFIKNQNTTYGAKLGFLYPSVQQPGIENIAQHGLKEGMRREWNETVNELTLNTSEIEKATNEFGLSGQMRVRFKYNFPMESSLTTSDGINAVMLWNMEAEINKQMGKADIVLSPVFSFLENAKSQAVDDRHAKQIDKVIDVLKYERDKYIYGQSFKKGGDIDNKVMNRKTLKLFMKAISFGRLGFDVAMQTGNMISGNIQMYIGSLKNVNWTAEDLLWTKKQIYSPNGFFAKLMGDYGKVSDVSFETKFYRMVNPTMKDMTDLVDLSTKSFSRRLLNRSLSLGNISFMIQDKGEMEIGLTTMLAVYHHAKFKVYDTNADGSVKVDTEGNPVYKLDTDGNILMVNGMEAFGEDAQGRIIRRPDVDITEDDARMLKRRVFNQIVELQGNYSDYTKTKIEGDILGVLLLYYRKYFPSALATRFGRARDNWENSEYKIGWYRIVWDMMTKYYGFGETMKSMLPGFVSDKIGGTKVNDFYRTRAQRAGREVMTAFVMMLIFNALRKSIFDGDDDEELPWLTAQFARTFAKVSNETRALVPLPLTGKMEDYVDNFTTFTTAFREGKTVAKFANNGLQWMRYQTFGGDEAYEAAYYQRKAGAYEEGDPKILKNFHDLTGYDNIMGLFSPGYKLKDQYRNR